MSFSTQTRAVVRVAGPVAYRVFASDLGDGRLEVRLATDDLLVHVRSASTAQRVRDTLYGTRPLVSALPFVLAARGGTEPTAPVLGIAGLVVHLPPATRCVANRMAATPGRRPRPAHIRLEVGPLTWEICDGAAWQALLQAWSRVTRLFGALAAEEPDH